jgi:hypothetical protein
VGFLGTRGDWAGATRAFRDAESDWPWRGAPVNQLRQARAWVADGAGTQLDEPRRARLIAARERVASGLARRAELLRARLPGGQA